MASQAAMSVGNARHLVQPTRAAAAPNAPRASAALQIFASLLWVPQAAFIAAAIGEVASGEVSTWSAWAVFGVFTIGIARALCDALGKRSAFLAGREAVTRRRMEAVASLAARSPFDIRRPEAGKAASVIAEQAEMIAPFVARFETAKTRAVVVPVFLLLAVLSLSWVAAIVLLVAAPLIPIFMALIGWRAKAASEAQLAQTGNMNAFLLDRLRGITTIRTFGAVDATANRLRANAESLRGRTMIVLRIAFLSSAVLELFSALGVAMVAVYIGFHLLGQLNFGTWSGPLSLSEGLFILLLAPAFFEPLRDLSSVWHDRASGRAAIEALNELSHDCERFPGSDKAAPRQFARMPQRAPSIVAKDLTFRHADDRALVFDHFNFAISAGEHVAIVGPSGSGKSTLIALLAGLVSPTAGMIFLNGHHLTEETAADLRRDMSWIGQRPHIFPGSLASNVRLGRDIDRSRVEAAMRFAKLDVIANARDLDSIGENGLGLSGGEALRLAIARAAIQSHAAIILADEPTSHLDVRTARDITDSLLALAGHKTMIVATHDLMLARRMDRVIQLGELPLENAA